MIIIDDCKTRKFKDPEIEKILMRGRNYQVMFPLFGPTNDITALSGTDEVEQKVSQVEEKKVDLTT